MADREKNVITALDEWDARIRESNKNPNLDFGDDGSVLMCTTDF